MAHAVMDPDWVKKAQIATSRPLRHVVEEVADDMRHMVPVDKGALHDSIETDFPDVTTGRVKVSTDHWHETEYGSPPHIIRVRTKKVLHNAETGEFFGKEVHHPGTPEQPFMRPAVYRQRDLG